MSQSFETMANRASDAVSRTADTASEELGAAADSLKTIANDQFDHLSETIRAKPLQSAAVAAGVGFLLAVIARR